MSLFDIDSNEELELVSPPLEQEQDELLDLHHDIGPPLDSLREFAEERDIAAIDSIHNRHPSRTNAQMSPRNKVVVSKHSPIVRKSSRGYEFGRRELIGIDIDRSYSYRYSFRVSSDYDSMLAYSKAAKTAKSTKAAKTAKSTKVYALTVYSGSGGGDYAAGAKVNITADRTPPGAIFDEWKVVLGDPGLGDISSSMTVLTMPAEDVQVEATYEPTYALRVIQGSGDGNYAAGEEVTIKAHHPEPGVWEFWHVISGNPYLVDNQSAVTVLIMPAGAVTVEGVSC